MNEQSQQSAGLARTPGSSGGITRGFNKPETPIELRKLQYKVAALAIPSVILGGCLAASAYFLSQALQASPNAQLIQAQREAQAQHAKQIETVAKNTGCGAFTLVCVTGQAEEKPQIAIQPPAPQMPRLPERYAPAEVTPIATQVADVDNPQMSVYWSSRFYDEQWTNAAVEMCHRDIWMSPECLALSEALHQ